VLVARIENRSISARDKDHLRDGYKGIKIFNVDSVSSVVKEWIMDDFGIMAKMLIAAGLALVFVGGLFLLSEKIPWLGHLPGDISIQRKNVHFYFPLGTCLLLSMILTLLFWVFGRR